MTEPEKLLPCDSCGSGEWDEWECSHCCRKIIESRSREPINEGNPVYSLHDNPPWILRDGIKYVPEARPPREPINEEALMEFMRREHFRIFGLEIDDSIKTEPNSWIDKMAKAISARFHIPGEVKWPEKAECETGITGEEGRVYAYNDAIDACIEAYRKAKEPRK